MSYDKTKGIDTEYLQNLPWVKKLVESLGGEPVRLEVEAEDGNYLYSGWFIVLEKLEAIFGEEIKAAFQDGRKYEVLSDIKSEGNNLDPFKVERMRAELEALDQKYRPEQGEKLEVQP